MPLLLVVLWLMQAAGALWWLYVWLVVAAYSLVLQMIFPTLIMPLFNKFSPLDRPGAGRPRRAAAGALRLPLARPLRDGRLEALVARQRLLRRLRRRQAHRAVRHAGRRACSPREVEAVLAHELGHYKLHHILKGMLLRWAISFALLFALGLAGRRAAGSTRASACTHPALPVALLLFMLVLPEFTFFTAAAAQRVLAQERIRGRRATRPAHASAGELVQRAGEAVPGQRRDAHARPAAFRVLRFASARQPTRIARLRTA